MPDYPIAIRLSEIADELRELSRKRRRMAGKDVSEAINKSSQDLYAVIAALTEPSAGTSAYQMVADAAQAQVGVTETLIHMVAATVLMKVFDLQGAGHLEISFSPLDMDEMHRRYEMTAKHDGLLTTVSIKPRADDLVTPMPPREANLEAKPESLMTQDEPEAPAKAQAAPHVYDRPLWAVRRDGKLYPASDRDQAERVVRNADPEDIVEIENRYCYHDDCPASGCQRDEKPDIRDHTFLAGDPNEPRPHLTDEWFEGAERSDGIE